MADTEEKKPKNAVAAKTVRPGKAVARAEAAAVRATKDARANVAAATGAIGT